MKKFLFTLLLTLPICGYAQSIDIDGETYHWEYNITGGVNTDGWQWDTGFTYFPLETIGLRMSIGFAGEIVALSDWDWDYYGGFYRDYDKNYTVRFKFMPALVLRTPKLVEWKSTETSFHFFAEPGLVLSPGADGSEGAKTVRYNFRGGINVQVDRVVLSFGYEYSNFSLYSGYPHNEHGLPDNDNYPTHSGFVGLSYKF